MRLNQIALSTILALTAFIASDQSTFNTLPAALTGGKKTWTLEQLVAMPREGRNFLPMPERGDYYIRKAVASIRLCALPGCASCATDPMTGMHRAVALAVSP